VQGGHIPLRALLALVVGCTAIGRCRRPRCRGAVLQGQGGEHRRRELRPAAVTIRMRACWRAISATTSPAIPNRCARTCRARAAARRPAPFIRWRPRTHDDGRGFSRCAARSPDRNGQGDLRRRETQLCRSANSDIYICYLRSDAPAKTFQDVLSHEVIIGASSAAARPAISRDARQFAGRKFASSPATRAARKSRWRSSATRSTALAASAGPDCRPCIPSGSPTSSSTSSCSSA